MPTHNVRRHMRRTQTGTTAVSAHARNRAGGQANIQKIVDLENRVMAMEREVQGMTMADRDYAGTLHVNLLSLARRLEKKFGFVRG